ncbi:hypothetical protein C8Q78DRAFT_820876 [Trametes maxima]|nr:hypothetical protein C8Q78DRAFT_820876 [Trametes maxima]
MLTGVRCACVPAYCPKSCASRPPSQIEMSSLFSSDSQTVASGAVTTSLFSSAAFPSSSLLFSTGSDFVTGSALLYTGPTSTATSSEANDPFDIYLGLHSTLNMSLSALLIGMLFAAISFGAVITKSAGYLQTFRLKEIVKQATVMTLALLNTAQMTFTAHAVFTSVIVDFGHLSGLLNNEWSIMVRIQMGIMGVTAAIAQSFFVCRLFIVKRNLLLTAAVVTAIIPQLAFSIYAVVEMFQKNYITVMLFDSFDVWPLVASFAISAGVNIVLAVCGYMWLQRPYEYRLRGRKTFVGEAEYWMLKGLLVCGVLSLYSAIGVSVMGLQLNWLGITFILGNLYTLSVLLNVTEQRPVAPFALSVASAPISESGSTYRASTNTLTASSGLWEDVAKARMTCKEKPEPIIFFHDDEKERYVLGYHTDATAV